MSTQGCETYSVREAADLLGICLNNAYKLINTGELPVLRLGRRLLIPRAALERLLREPLAVQGEETSERP